MTRLRNDVKTSRVDGEVVCVSAVLELEQRLVHRGVASEPAVGGGHGDATKGRHRAPPPREIEELLMEHPAVSLLAVIGVPHESHGEEIKAVVVRTAGDETTEAELVAWAKNQLAAYKHPRIVEFADTLPMTATGKILKRELA